MRRLVRRGGAMPARVVAILAVLVAASSAPLVGIGSTLTQLARADSPVQIGMSPSAPAIAAGSSLPVALIANAPAPGLGAWTIDVAFDSAVATPSACTPSADSVCNIAYAIGIVRVSGANATGISGTTTLATITFQAIGAPGAASALTPSIANNDCLSPTSAALTCVMTSGSISVGQPIGTPAATPTNLAATDVTGTSATVRWTDHASDEDGYRVITFTGGTWAPAAADLPANTTSLLVTGLTPGSYNAFWVIALKNGGLTYAGTYITVVALSGVPEAPRPIAASGVSGTSVLLNWEDRSANESGFKVLRYNGSTWPEVGSTAADSTTFTDSGLTPGVTYAYWLVAYNANGLAYSDRYIAATSVAFAINAPLYTGGSSTGVTATVNWLDRFTGETAYEVERQGPGGGFAVVSPSLPPGTQTFTDTGLTPGAYYAYWVVAVQGGARTYAGTYQTIITDPGLPARPFPASAAGISSSAVQIRWNDLSDDEAGFTVLRFDGAAWQPIGSTGANVTSYTDTNRSAGTQYAYWIVSTNAAGDRAYAPAYIAANTTP